MHRTPGKMFARLWSTSGDDSIEYRSLTSDQLEGALEVMRGSFFIQEKACVGVELSKDPEAAAELEELCARVARDGLSLIAMEKETRKVVGVAFNKLQVKASTEAESCFKQFAANCKRARSKALVEFMVEADSIVDLFDVCKVDCLLELMFLSVLPASSGRGIGARLAELTCELVKTLKSGENVKVPLDDQELPIDPIPSAVSAIFTSNITQHLGKKLGFKTATVISYDKIMFEGKSLASRIGPDTPVAMVEFKIL